MATKKTDAVAQPQPNELPAQDRQRSDAVADAETLAPLQGDIDSRMAALLKDHQAMGARPK